MSRFTDYVHRFSPHGSLDRLLNRRVPEPWRIEMRSSWPLFFVPVLLFMQLLGPSPVWVALLFSLIGLYGISYAWIRSQVQKIFFERRREGAMLVVGDAMQERFIVRNDSPLPVHWLEFADSSFLPGYNPRQVISCGSGSSYQWRAEANCTQRGVFRLGPHKLRTGDPFGLFGLETVDSRSESLLVYPRVAHIPTLDLPRGSLSGQDRRRRAYSGSERSQAVRAYRPGDSLRHVHWPSSARQGELFVTDVETEPSGDLWIVLDANGLAQTGEGEDSSLETSIILAASVAAEFLGGGERRSVGLLTAPAVEATTGWPAEGPAADGQYPSESDHADGEWGSRLRYGEQRSDMANGKAAPPALVDVPPQPGKGQVWQILAALAPVNAGDLPLGELLRRSRGVFNAGQTVLAITSDIGAGVEDWTAELLHLRRVGVSASVFAVTPAGSDMIDENTILEESVSNSERPEDSPPLAISPPDEQDPESDSASVQSDASLQANLIDILAKYEIPLRFMQAGTQLAPALTYRRTRTVLRTTPSGGVVAHEIEEEVG